MQVCACHPLSNYTDSCRSGTRPTWLFMTSRPELHAYYTPVHVLASMSTTFYDNYPEVAGYLGVHDNYPQCLLTNYP